MNAQLSIFNFQNHTVRIEIKDNEPLFCLTDIAEVLEITNPHATRFNLNPKGIHNMYTLTKGGKQELTFIDEPNLYRIIFKSRKEEAILFQNWIFEEVIPAIRKTGSYQKTTEPAITYEPKKCEVNDDVLHSLFGFLFIAHAQATVLKDLYPALRKMMSKLHPEVYSLYSETSLAFSIAQRSLEEQLIKLSQNSREWRETLNKFNALKTVEENKPQTIRLNLR